MVCTFVEQPLVPEPIQCTIDANDNTNGDPQTSLKACQDMCNNLFMNMETVITTGGAGRSTGIADNEEKGIGRLMQ